MLDLDHPETKFIFAIAREDDAILSIAKRMTLVSTEEKADLLIQGRKHIANMRDILVEGWKKSRKKSAAIDLLSKNLEEFALVESTNDFVDDWKGKICSVCCSEITNLEGYEDMTYCSTCLDKFGPGREAVDKAFGLMFI